ncbi:MAG: cytochrome c [Chloroflexi bacterium]|nr:cytochrome c [Chloroflexota bacterium]MBP8054474.1 cytochrome c [Chloroflexota bacterium]
MRHFLQLQIIAAKGSVSEGIAWGYLWLYRHTRNSLIRSVFTFWGLLVLLTACGTEASAPTATLDPVAAAGEIVFQKNCGSCHSTAPDTVVVGPSLAGVATRAATRIPGQDAPGYILSSIMRPDEYLVEGFDNSMPNNFGRKLTGEEIDSVIAYLLTLK